MLNPERNQPIAGNTNRIIRFEIQNPRLPELRLIIKSHIPLKNWEIVSIKDGNETTLLNNELRNVMERTKSYGLSQDDFVEEMISEIRNSDSVIIRKIDSDDLKFKKIIEDNFGLG